jgi:hypothetical protein
MSETRQERRCDAVALALLALLTLAFFWKIALTNRVLAGIDVFAYFYPYRDYVSASLQAGHLPLWNPYLFMGAPLLANSQAAVLYPLHWPLIWLSAPKQVAWSIVFHIWLAGAGTYLFARRAVRLRASAALVAASIFALGGFLGAQVEHVNQLNDSAWLPWLLLCLDGTATVGRRRWLAMLAGGGIVGLMLLAGHTQAAYIVLFGAALFALSQREWRSALRKLAALAGMVVLGLVLAAGQLLPTLELSRLSVRSGGLPYNEAASFSLKPQLIFKAFLPPLLWDPLFSEYVAYVGLVGLALAALSAWAIVRRRQRGWAFVILAAVGVFLAFGAYNPAYYVLYKLVPGFALFRAPARWLLLYSFGAAILAGLGLEVVAGWKSPPGNLPPPPREGRKLPLPLEERVGVREELCPEANLPPPPAPPPREGRKLPLPLGERVGVRGKWAPLLLLLLIAELFLAGRKLAYNQPTAPAAYDSMRSAPAHLLADAASEPFRFLSLSDILYDPGDLGDLVAMYGDQLSDKALADLLTATKMKEVLAYNLPLRYRLYSVDGYDGGLLPIASYVTLERLFLAEEDIWSDGRLRQQLRHIPPSRLLSLLNVKYVITDKMQDVWIDGVFYDLEHTVPLGTVSLEPPNVPDLATTDLGIVSYLTGSLDLEAGTPVARVSITDEQGQTHTATLRAGEHTAEGLYQPGTAQHPQAQVGHTWRDNEAGSDYVAVLDLGQTLRPQRIQIESLLPGEALRLRGLTLIDRSTGANRTVTIDPAYRLVHSGDVKVYEHVATLPRAFVVHQATVLADDEAALAALGNPAFDPAQTAILAEGQELTGDITGSPAEIVAYEPELVRVRASLDTPGYLVLTDTDYPGWQAKVDGQPAPIVRADLYFRAVALAAGEHEITFHYRPTRTYLGLLLSLLAWLAWAVTGAALLLRIGRRNPSSV